MSSAPHATAAAATEGAKLMADFVFRMSGARLEVVKESALKDARVADGRIEAKGAGGKFILIGESALAKQLGAIGAGLGNGGILIRTLPNALVMLGADARTPDDPWGSRHAVTTLLDEVLGCRYLWPGETGLVVPWRDTVRVSAIERQSI